MNELQRTTSMVVVCSVWMAATLGVACSGSDDPAGGSGNDAAATSSGGSSSGESSSSGGSSSGESSSSGGSSGATDASDQDAGDDSGIVLDDDGSVTCGEPRPATFGDEGPPGCGAFPIGSEDSAVAYQPFAEAPTYTGGVILPGIYTVVKAETASAEPPSKTKTVLTLGADGKLARSFADYDVPALDGADIVLLGGGTYGAAGTTLTLSYTCRSQHQPAAEAHQYSAYTVGCNDYLEIGTTASRITFVRSRNIP